MALAAIALVDWANDREAEESKRKTVTLIFWIMRKRSEESEERRVASQEFSIRHIGWDLTDSEKI